MNEWKAGHHGVAAGVGSHFDFRNLTQRLENE
jgi:hypothetical protein